MLIYRTQTSTILNNLGYKGGLGIVTSGKKGTSSGT